MRIRIHIHITDQLIVIIPFCRESESEAESAPEGQDDEDEDENDEEEDKGETDDAKSEVYDVEYDVDSGDEQEERPPQVFIINIGERTSLKYCSSSCSLGNKYGIYLYFSDFIFFGGEGLPF